jgi:hypothetical protein
MEKEKKKSLRRYNTYLKALRQLKISKRDDLSLGYFKKQNAMDCGITKCYLCGNPRRSKVSNKKDKLTYQEKKYL